MGTSISLRYVNQYNLEEYFDEINVDIFVVVD